jgi:3-hydroxyisobutyrate dehydrogenase
LVINSCLRAGCYTPNRIIIEKDSYNREKLGINKQKEKYMERVIGFIGIGAMGSYMSWNLLKASYKLVVYDIRKEAMEDIIKIGAEKASSPQDLANQCSIMITMLPASADVEAAILGPEGVINGTAPGDIVVDMSSSHPTSTKMIHETLAEKGVRMLDAPVSGGVKGAREATLTIMVGGEEKDYEELRPVFNIMGQNIYYVGTIGAGHTVKALNNLCSACSLAITSEVLVVASKLGLSPKKIVDIINSSTGRSWSSQYKFPNFVLNNAFNSGFSIGLMNKDLEIATSLSRELHTPMFVGTIVQQLYSYAIGQGKASDCHTVIAKVIEKWGNVKKRSLQ